MKSFRYFGKTGIVKYPNGNRGLTATGSIYTGEVKPEGKWVELTMPAYKMGVPADNKMVASPEATKAAVSESEPVKPPKKKHQDE